MAIGGLVGTFERHLDAAGRVTLPADLRKDMGEECYLLYGEGGCVTVMPTEVFTEESARMTEAWRAGRIAHKELRRRAAEAQRVSIDKQGRLMLDDTRRRFAALETEAAVVVTGALDRLEIWSPEGFARNVLDDE